MTFGRACLRLRCAAASSAAAKPAACASRVRGATGAAVYDELNSAVQATPTPLPLLAGKRLPGPRRARGTSTHPRSGTTASHHMPNKTSPVKVAARRTRCKTSSSPAHRCLTPLRQQS